MRETNENDVSHKAEESGYLKNKGVARWGCFLVLLMVIAIFVIIFVYGQYAANPRY